MMPSHEPSQRQFATTRWSLVKQPDASRGRNAGGALIELCLRYWYPVYAYVRRCGHAPAIAQDITRSFLQHLLQRFREADEPMPPGQFRRYLLARLNAFLADDWRAQLDQVDEEVLPVLAAVAPADIEARNRCDNVGASSPEQAYQYSFALEVLTRASARLREEASETGHLDMYEALLPHLAQDPEIGGYEELARGLGARPLTLVIALKRLRQRFRELIGEELADTVDSPADLAAEQRELHALLRTLA